MQNLYRVVHADKLCKKFFRFPTESFSIIIYDSTVYGSSRSICRLFR